MLTKYGRKAKTKCDINVTAHFTQLELLKEGKRNVPQITHVLHEVD